MLQNAGAIAHLQIFQGQFPDIAPQVHNLDVVQHVLHLPAVGAGVHIHRPANAARDAIGKFQAG